MPYIRPLGDTTTVDLTVGGESSMSELLGTILDTWTLPTATSDDVATAAGGASISASDFTTRAGVCKAANLTALNYVKEMQRQLNRVAQMKGFGKIGVDGEVGPGTLALFGKVQAAAGGTQIMGTPGTCMGVAPDADVLSAQVQAYADSLGAPAQVSASFTGKAPTIINKQGQEALAAGVLDTFMRLPALEQIAVVGVLGGIGYMLMTGRKRRSARGTRR